MYEFLWCKCLFEFQITIELKAGFMSSWFPAKTYNYPRKMCGLLCCFHYFVCSPIVLTLCVFTQERFAWQFKFLYQIQNHLWSFKTWEGQWNSEWIYEVIISPKIPTKYYRDFCRGSLLEANLVTITLLWQCLRKIPYQIKVDEEGAQNSLTKFVINLDLKTGLRDDFA